MADENETTALAARDRLGTGITFVDPEHTGRAITVHGVSLAPGVEADLADFMDEPKAREIAARLAQNPYFRVEGGPDHQAELERREQRRQEQREAVSTTIERQRQRLAPAQREGLPPENYAAPEEATLASRQAPRTTEAQSRAQARAQARGNPSNTRK